MAMGWADEQLKQAVAKLEDALKQLRELETKRERKEDDVEGNMIGYSDERLKQTVAKLDDALGQLRQLGSETKARAS